MKNLSTGTGLAILAGAALAYPFVSSLAPNANAVGVGPTAVSAVAAAATAQGAPTIVWYGVSSPSAAFIGSTTYQVKAAVFRAWSDGKIEIKQILPNTGTGCVAGQICPEWQVFSNPAQGLTFDADLNFDEAVDGNDLGMLLAKWGPAPRNPVPPSDCPLALINP